MACGIQGWNLCPLHWQGFPGGRTTSEVLSSLLSFFCSLSTWPSSHLQCPPETFGAGTRRASQSPRSHPSLCQLSTAGDSLSICFGPAHPPYFSGKVSLSPDIFCSYGMEVVRPNVTEENLSLLLRLGELSFFTEILRNQGCPLSTCSSQN